MQYQEEKFSKLYNELVPLLKEHRSEINLFNKDLEIDGETYIEWERANTSRLYTVRSEGKLVGYCLMVLFTHNHHKTSLHATQDVLFLSKEYRGHGLTFLRYCEERLKEEGVNVIHQCVPSCNDWGKVLEFKGYKKLETIYVKEL